MKRAAALALVTLVVATLSFLCLGQTVRVSASSGTGFVVSPDGYLLTNEHVVHGATQVTVTANATEYPAAVVRTDPDNDIALLKISATGLPVVALGDSDRVAIGDTVYTIGCPRGICGTATQGRVANVNVGTENMILVDLTATHGSSGGPLFNARGEVVGITTAGLIANAEGETSGFTLAVPINRAAALLASVTMLGGATAGQTPGELDLPTLAGRLSPAVSYIEAERLRSLESYLPTQALGVSVTLQQGSFTLPRSDPFFGPVFPDRSAYVWSWFPSALKSCGVEIQEAVVGRWNSSSAGFQTWVLDLRDSSQSSLALGVLRDVSASRWGDDTATVDSVASREQWEAGSIRIDIYLGVECYANTVPLATRCTLSALAYFAIDDLVFAVRASQTERFDVAHSYNIMSLRGALAGDGCVVCSYEALDLLATPREWVESVRVGGLCIGGFKETLESFLNTLLQAIGQS
jgi:hypothetical protein